jgi:hypothetical protein
MRALRFVLFSAVAALACNGKTATPEAHGEDVAFFGVCSGSVDPSCATFDESFSFSSDCSYRYARKDLAWATVAPARECTDLLDVLRSVEFQATLKSPGVCGATGEVVTVELASGARLKNDIAGCRQTTFLEMRTAVEAVKAAYRLDAGLDGG